jgi:cytochrome c5
MKKTILFAITLISITIACKSKKAATSTVSSDSNMDAQLVAVNIRFPNTTMEELKKGHSIYTGACTKCHGTKDVTVYTEPKLLEIVDVMAKKAEITAEEKQALIKFAVGVRATSK